MYLVLGDISSVLTWFNSQDNRSKFLCLLVAGHLRDLKFFQDVFEQRLALDTISGHNIAILLFTNDPVGVVSIEVGGGQTFGDKHAQQFLEDSGQGSEQAACHASTSRRVCLLPPDVILSPCVALRVNSAKDLARWAPRCFAALSMTARTAVKAAHGGKSYLQMSGHRRNTS